MAAILTGSAAATVFIFQSFIKKYQWYKHLKCRKYITTTRFNNTVEKNPRKKGAKQKTGVKIGPPNQTVKMEGE